MMTRSITLAVAAITVLAYGCGKSSDGRANNGGPAPMSVNGPSAQDRAKHEAKMVVTDFLNAFRRGDDAKAKTLLTKVARQKAEEKGRAVAPPANDNVKIEVDEPTLLPPDHDIAHVPTRWIDQDENGKPRTDKATWYPPVGVGRVARGGLCRLRVRRRRSGPYEL